MASNESTSLSGNVHPHRCHTASNKSLNLLIFIDFYSLKGRFYAGLGDVGVLVFATYFA
jgi:hypothetical protein